MRTVYKVLAYLVAAEVAIQALVVVWAVFGLFKWVDGGGVLDKAVIEGIIFGGASPFTEVLGITMHGINGVLVVPLLALLLLIVSFFTKVRGATKWAVIVFALVVVQVMLGILGHWVTLGGALHGLNALALFGTAIYAGRRLRAVTAAAVEQPEARTATPVS